jgi:hypothetical protein
MSDQTEHGPLAAVLRDAAAGRFPPPNSDVTVLPPPSPRDSGVLGFTAHAVVFTDADPAWVRARLPGANGVTACSTASCVTKSI